MILLFYTELLIVPLEGIYLRTSYYSDGSFKEERIVRGPRIISEPIFQLK